MCNPKNGNTPYAYWVERFTNTWQGGLTKADRRLPQRIVATKDNWCPVHFLQKFIYRDPQLWGSKDLCIYVQSRVVTSGIQNSLLVIIRSPTWEIATEGGLDITNKWFTNHSIQHISQAQKSWLLQDIGMNSDLKTAIADMEDHQHISAVLSVTKVLQQSFQH